jgi:hypothetical protein
MFEGGNSACPPGLPLRCAKSAVITFFGVIASGGAKVAWVKNPMNVQVFKEPGFFLKKRGFGLIICAVASKARRTAFLIQ